MSACFAGTSSVDKAFLLLSKHERLIGCRVDPSTKTVVTLQLILINAQHVLSKESDFDGDK